MAQQRRTVTELLRILLPIIILAIAIAGFVLLRSLKEKPASASPEASTTTVETVDVLPHHGGISIVVTGEVVPYREVNVAAEVSGRVITKEPICETGTFVQEGDVLFKIDEQDYQLEKRRLTKELEQSQAFIRELAAEIEGVLERLQVAGQEVASAEEEYQRQQNLKGIVSDSQIDRAKRDWLAARNAEIQVKNQYQLLESRKLRLTSAMELAQVQLEKAQLDLERTTVRSPVPGVITSEHAQEDDYVQAGETMVTIEDTSRAEITCHLDAEDEQWIWLSHPDLLEQREAADEPWRDYELPRTKATVIYKRANVEYQWDGVLTRYDGLGFDPMTRTIPCRVVVSDPRRERIIGGHPGSKHNVGPRALVRGMYVTVELHTEPQVPLFRVPLEAVQPGNLLWTVVSIDDAAGKRKTVLRKRNIIIVDQVKLETEVAERDDKSADIGRQDSKSVATPDSPGLQVRGTAAETGKRPVADPPKYMAVVYSPDDALSAGDMVVTSPLSTPRDGKSVQFGEDGE